MRSRLSKTLIGGSAAALAVPLLALPAAAGTSGSSRVALPDSAPSAHGAAVGNTNKATSVSFQVILKLRDAAGAEAMAMAVSDPASASYRHYLTPAQWRTRFAPTGSTVSSVTSWLRGQGMKVSDTSANHRILAVSGSVAAVEKAFGTTLKDFSKNGVKVHAHASALSVPRSVAGAIDEVGGLDETATVTPTVGLPGPPPAFVNAPPCSQYYGQKVATNLPRAYGQHQPYAPCGYTPPQLQAAYGTAHSIARGIDGRGTRVSIVDAYAAPTIVNDANTYASRNGVPQLRNGQFRQNNDAPYTHQTLCGPQGWYGEETLDVEAVHGMAPGADILYVGAKSCLNSDIRAAVNKIVDKHLADIISNSYGISGEQRSRGDHQNFLQAAAEGIGVFFSSGDSGDEIARTGSRTVDSPASDPLVTAVGGTSLGVGKNRDYLFETGWGTGRSYLQGHAWVPAPPGDFQYGGGGGTSHLFKQPSYQKGVVPPSISNYFGEGPHRAVPDIAAVGDPNTGMLVGETQAFPNGNHYGEYRIGGTSLSCPLVAGIEALANQLNGGSLGFVNPKLYSLYKTDAFRDIKGQGVTKAVVRVDYLNGVNAADGTYTTLRSLNFTGTIVVRPGYDDVTGLGTPNGPEYLRLLAH